MWSLAEIKEVTILVGGEHLILVFIDEFLLVFVVLEGNTSLIGGDVFTDIWVILFGAFLHLGLDAREVLFGDFGIAEIDVIVITFFDRRTITEFASWIQMGESLGHEVGGAVVKHLESLFGAFLDEFDLFAFR